MGSQGIAHTGHAKQRQTAVLWCLFSFLWFIRGVCSAASSNSPIAMVTVHQRVQEGGSTNNYNSTLGTPAAKEHQNLLIRYGRQWWNDETHRIYGHQDFRQFWPKFEFSWELVIGTTITIYGSAVGIVGGVGGGNFYFTMLNLLLGFDTKTSAALTKAMVMGATISSVLWNLREKHPTENKPVIDYDMGMLFQPMLLLGVSIGVLLNVMVPEWLITVLLIILFAKLSAKTMEKATALWEKEFIQLTQQKTGDFQNGEYASIASAPTSYSDPLPPEEQTGKITWQWMVWDKMALLVFTWVVFLIIQTIKVNVPTCTFWYWFLNFLQVPVAFGVTIYNAMFGRNFNNKKDRRGQGEGSSREEAGPTELPLRVDLHELVGKTLSDYILYSLIGLCAGTLGGLLGIGGGSILGPAFLELGLPPQVASTTSTFIMFFSSSLSVWEFHLLRRLPNQYAIFLGLVSMVAAACGQYAMRRIVKGTGRPSIIVFILSFCFASAGTLLGITGGMRSYIKWQSGKSMGFDNVCHGVRWQF